MGNWYIDFDSTLYDTQSLTNDMLEKMALHIDKSNKDNILQELKSLFNREHIYNIFDLCDYFEKKYSLETNYLLTPVKEIISNGFKYVYDDVISFLNKLKEKGNKVQMLTSSITNENMEFHELKINGAGISNYFDTIIITATPKHELDFKYENGIFVDDNPKDLENLYNVNGKRIIHKKRKNGRYSDKPLNISKIEEYTTLSEILI